MIQDIMRGILFVPETKPISDLLNEFQIKHKQMAVVVNEYPRHRRYYNHGRYSGRIGR